MRSKVVLQSLVTNIIVIIITILIIIIIIIIIITILQFIAYSRHARLRNSTSMKLYLALTPCASCISLPLLPFSPIFRRQAKI